MIALIQRIKEKIRRNREERGSYYDSRTCYYLHKPRTQKI
jgi:hypothetical protein